MFRDVGAGFRLEMLRFSRGAGGGREVVGSCHRLVD